MATLSGQTQEIYAWGYNSCRQISADPDEEFIAKGPQLKSNTKIVDYVELTAMNRHLKKNRDNAAE